MKKLCPFAVVTPGLGLCFSIAAGAQSFRLAPIADATIAKPGGGVFDRVQFSFDARGDRTAFIHTETTAGTRPGVWALYLVESGAVRRLLRTGDPIPGTTGSFDSLISPVMLDDGVAFVGRDGATLENTIFVARNGSIEVLINEANLGEPLFPRVTSAGDDLAFLNAGQSPSVQLVDGGVLIEIARVGNLAPGGGTFTQIRNLRMSPELVVFSASTTIGRRPLCESPQHWRPSYSRRPEQSPPWSQPHLYQAGRLPVSWQGLRRTR